MIAALVSQVRGLAVFDDGERVRALLEEDGRPTKLPPRALGRLLRGAGDVEAIVVPDLDALRSALVERREREEALRVVLVLIDGELDPAQRKKAAAAWMEVCAPTSRAGTSAGAEEPVVRYGEAPPMTAAARWAEGVLMTIPVPETADLRGCLPWLAPDARAMLERLQQQQPAVRIVHAAIVAACRRTGVEPAVALAHVAQAGWARDMVLGRELYATAAQASWPWLRAWLDIVAEDRRIRTPTLARVGDAQPSGESAQQSTFDEDESIRQLEQRLGTLAELRRQLEAAIEAMKASTPLTADELIKEAVREASRESRSLDVKGLLDLAESDELTQRELLELLKGDLAKLPGKGVGEG